MSRRRRRLAALFTAFALLACGGEAAPGPVPGYPFAYAWNDCAPWDGPAVTLYLSERALDSLPPSSGQLTVTLWVGRDQAVGRTFRSSDDPVRGAALDCRTPSACEPASVWRVSLRGFARDTLDGSVDLRLGGRVVAGSFRARWMPKRMLCG